MWLLPLLQGLPENNWKIKIRIQTFHLTPVSSCTGLWPSYLGKLQQGEASDPFPAWFWVIRSRYYCSRFFNSLIGFDDCPLVSHSNSIPAPKQTKSEFKHRCHLKFSSHQALSQLQQKTSFLSADLGTFPTSRCTGNVLSKQSSDNTE